ncbi:jg3386 [Pararge aegeria aegeria]|uniref:Jg3386 protein n=1 Tax=Pararge aegeria aegeria TaxID=348720 RepID=A0A8S4RQF1_9NEOP|nr:jg3386 [Pararge aegeria aegeria]
MRASVLKFVQYRALLPASDVWFFPHSDCKIYACRKPVARYIKTLPARKPETAWRRNGDWKARYSKLYSSKGISGPNVNDVCIHGYNIRITTDRSMSRSRFSRISTRRDMDIPSILAYDTFTTAPLYLGIPAFQKVQEMRVDIPRWSIRRSVCPVCSQKWKDRSSITNVKYSGLKRNSSKELPSITAPARLRTYVATKYVPRSVSVADDKKSGVLQGGFRNSSASWQLTRARRFRTPRPQQPPPEATAPPSCSAPTARKDLDLRVSRFLSDEFRSS